MSRRRKLAVLGSTGSIGRSVLAVVEASPDAFEVVSLSALSSGDLLREQAARHGARRVAVGEALAGVDMGAGVSVGVGEEALADLAADPDVDLVVNAIVGTAGLSVTAAAVSAGKRLAIANKESLVMAGELITRLAAETGSELVPVDSEHSSVFRCMRGALPGEVDGIVLTASGGPLRDLSLAETGDADVATVLSHPNWEMGAKITVDSATLANKAMEVIEAKWLFGLPLDRIDVVLHRESVVHSLVRMRDGSFVAHLGLPDMRVPIQYALFYPDAPPSPFGEFAASEIGALSFAPVPPGRYPCFDLMLESERRGGTAPTIAAAADEVAVAAFLAGDIAFRDIGAVIERTLERESAVPAPDLKAVFAAERSARAAAAAVVDEISGTRGAR